MAFHANITSKVAMYKHHIATAMFVMRRILCTGPQGVKMPFFNFIGIGDLLARCWKLLHHALMMLARATDVATTIIVRMAGVMTSSIRAIYPRSKEA